MFGNAPETSHYMNKVNLNLWCHMVSLGHSELNQNIFVLDGLEK